MGLLLTAGACTGAATSGNVLSQTQTTLHHQAVTLQSSHAVRLESVNYTITGGRTTTVTVTLGGDAREVLNLVARPVRATFAGSGLTIHCTEDLLDLDNRTRATCSPLSEDATKPRRLIVSVG